MKKCYSFYAGPAYYGMCSTDVYCSKQTGSSSTKGYHHHFFVSGIGQRKLSMQPKNGGAENVKASPANIRKWIARFYYFRHLYSAGSTVCIAHNNCMSCPSIWATLSALLINILLGSFQLFLHSDQPLSEGEIIPFSGVCQSGRLHYPRRRRW